MAQQARQDKIPPSGSFSIRRLLIILLLVFIIGGVVIFFLFQPQAIEVAVGPRVNINSPHTGDRAEVNTPVIVRATARDETSVRRVELYADGALVASQDTILSDGSNPLQFLQSWIPLTTGRHVLVARAYNMDGQRADSPVVYLDVLELLSPSFTIDVDSIPRGEGIGSPSLSDLAKVSGIPLEDLRESNPELGETDPATPLPPGTPIVIPRTPLPPPPVLPPPLPLPGTPTAPATFTVTADCTRANLSWSDSADEESYTIYRLGPGDIFVNPIATLPAGSTAYDDPLPGLGRFLYQVAAVRGGLEGASPMFQVETPSTCTPPVPSPATTAPVLSILRAETDPAAGRYDGIYCYFRIDGTPWQRAPLPDFALFTPQADPNFHQFNLAGQLPNGGHFLLAGHAADTPVTLDGICYAQRGPEVFSLGQFTVSHPPSDWDGTQRSLTLSPTTLYYWLGPNSPQARYPDLMIEIPPELLLPVFEMAPTLPAPTNLRFDPTSREACADLGLLSYRLRCTVGGMPTLLWDWGDPSGHFPRDQVSFQVDISAEGALWGTFRYPSNHFVVFPENVPACSDQPAEFRVKTAFDPRDGTPLLFSPEATLLLPLPACPSDVTLEITYSTYAIGPSSATGEVIDDGDICIFCTDRRLELLGGMGSTGPQTHGWVWAGGILRAPPFPLDIGGVISFIFEHIIDVLGAIFTGCMPFTTCVGETERLFSGELLIRDGDIFAYRDNNIIHLRIHEGESLTLGTAITDFDLLNGPDLWCLTSAEVPRRSGAEWSRYNDRVLLQDDRGEGSCTIVVNIRAQ